MDDAVAAAECIAKRIHIARVGDPVVLVRARGTTTDDSTSRIAVCAKVREQVAAYKSACSKYRDALLAH